MRWLVEVTSIGKNDKETFCVDAESWQRALQVTRTLRKETAPMSGFSIELLDEGCRAVDPMSRLRYEVKRARDDAPLTPGAQTAAAATPGASAPPPAPAAPRPVSQPPPAPKKSVGKSTAFMGSSAGQVQAIADAPKPAPVAAQAPIASTHVAAPPPAATPSSQIIYKREQDPSATVPLAYREYVFVVAQGTTESAAEAVLRAQLDQVRASLAPLASGKLVQLAVFDVMFKGRPPVRPLATLVWKDWRPAPTVGFPRRPGYVAPTYSATPPPVAPGFPPAPSAQQAPPQAQPIARPETPPSIAPQRPQAPSFEIKPPPTPPNDTQRLPAITDATPVIPAAPPPPPGAAPPPAAPQPDLSRTVQSQALAPAASMRAAQPRARARGDELIAELFETMHDLHFLRDAIDGAAFVLALSLEKLSAEFGVVHLYDIDRREFVVASARGPGSHVLLLARYQETEPLIQAAMRKRRAIIVSDAAHADGSSTSRFAALGTVRSLVVAPVMQSGRFLGVIEIVNPLDGNPFTDDEGNALNYIAEQYAEFVATVGVVTDADRITTAAAAQPARR